MARTGRPERDHSFTGPQYRSEADDWTTTGARINTEEKLAAIKSTLEEAGPVIVEWRHFRGSNAPDRLIFEDFDKFVAWLQTTAAGDSIWVWDYAAVCRDDNPIARDKCPNESGEVPTGGPY